MIDFTRRAHLTVNKNNNYVKIYHTFGYHSGKVFVSRHHFFIQSEIIPQ